jgi:hypothetical protein
MRLNLEEFKLGEWMRICRGEHRPEHFDLFYKNDRLSIVFKKKIEFRNPPMEMWNVVGKQLGLDWAYDENANSTSVRIVELKEQKK